MRTRVIQKGENKIHLQKDLNLTKTEYNNFQKLRFHGLIARYKEDGKNTAGCWLITKRGAEFLNGVISVPTRVKTFRNKVVEHDTDLVKVVDIIKRYPFPYVETEFQFSLFTL